MKFLNLYENIEWDFDDEEDIPINYEIIIIKFNNSDRNWAILHIIDENKFYVIYTFNEELKSPVICRYYITNNDFVFIDKRYDGDELGPGVKNNCTPYTDDDITKLVISNPYDPYDNNKLSRKYTYKDFKDFNITFDSSPLWNFIKNKFQNKTFEDFNWDFDDDEEEYNPNNIKLKDKVKVIDKIYYRSEDDHGEYLYKFIKILNNATTSTNTFIVKRLKEHKGRVLMKITNQRNYEENWPWYDCKYWKVVN